MTHTQIGRTVARGFELDAIIKAGITVTTDQITDIDFVCLRLIAEGRAQAEREAEELGKQGNRPGQD